MNAIELYFDDLDNEQLAEIGLALHQLVMGLVPQVQGQIKWKIPFYIYHRQLCYIFPRKNFVDLSFVQGTQLSNEQGLLVARDRKQIRSIPFYNLEEVYREGVAEVILEAALINENIAAKK